MSDSNITYTAYTKLMENLRLTPDAPKQSAMNLAAAPSGICACLNKDNIPVLIVTLADGGLLCLRKDGTGDADFLSEPLFGTASSAALGMGPGSYLYLFLLRSGKVYLRKETTPGSGIFGVETQLALAKTTGAAENILLKALAGGLLVGVVCKEEDSRKRLDCALYKTGTEPFSTLMEPCYVSALVFAGNTEQDARLCAAGASYAEYRVSDKVKTTYSGDVAIVKQLAWVTWLDTNGLLLARDSFDELYVLERSGEGKAIVLRSLFKNSAFHVFSAFSACSMPTAVGYRAELLTSEGKSCHVSLLQKPGESILPSNPVPLERNSVAVCMPDTVSMRMEGYMLFSDSRQVVQLCRSYSGDYARKEIPLPGITNDAAGLRKTPCFSTEFTLMDHNKVPLAHKDVTLSSSDVVYVDLPDGPRRVGPRETAALQTDAQGKLQLIQDTDGFACAVLTLSLTQNGTAESLQIRQSEPVYQRLSGVSAKDFAEAKKHDGKYLLPISYRSEEDAEKLLTPMRDMLALVPLHATRANAVGVVHGSDETALTALAPPQNGLPRSFRLTFGDDNALTYEPLNAETALLRRREMEGLNFSLFFSNIGDVCHGIVGGLITAREILVSGFEVGMRFALDGIEYLFFQTFKTVRQVLDLCLSIFARVGVAFSDLFEWMGFILDWDDILRFQQAIAFFLPLSIHAAQAETPSAKAAAAQCISEARIKAHQTIASLKTQFTGKSFYQYAMGSAPTDTRYEQAVSNDILRQKLLVKTDGLNALLQNVPQNDSATNRIYEAVAAFMEGKEDAPEVRAMNDYAKNAYGTNDSMAGALFGTLLDKLDAAVDMLLTGGDTLAGAVIDQADDMGDYLLLYLTNQMEIAYLTQFWKSISGGQPLTILNLVALLVAVPSTILYKLVCGISPFENDAEVAAFKQEVTAFFGQNALGTHKSRPAFKFSTRQKIRIVSANACLLNYAILAFLDSGALDNWFSATLSLGVESIWTAAGYPSIFGDKTKTSRFLWGYSAVGLALDVSLTIYYKRHADQEAHGKFFTCAYGILHFFFVFAAMDWGLGKAAAFCWALAEGFKPLTIIPLSQSDAKFIDVFFDGIGGELGFFADMFSVPSLQGAEETQ